MRTRNEQQYLSNLATTMIRQLKMPDSCGGISPQLVYEQFGNAVKAKLLEMNPETRGRIADLGHSFENSPKGTCSLYVVHCGSYLGKYQSGRDLVTEIAATTIIAKICDLLSAKVREIQQITDEIEAELEGQEEFARRRRV